MARSDGGVAKDAEELEVPSAVRWSCDALAERLMLDRSSDVWDCTGRVRGGRGGTGEGEAESLVDMLPDSLA